MLLSSPPVLSVLFFVFLLPPSQLSPSLVLPHLSFLLFRIVFCLLGLLTYPGCPPTRAWTSAPLFDSTHLSRAARSFVCSPLLFDLIIFRVHTWFPSLPSVTPRRRRLDCHTAVISLFVARIHPLPSPHLSRHPSFNLPPWLGFITSLLLDISYSLRSDLHYLSSPVVAGCCLWISTRPCAAALVAVAEFELLHRPDRRVYLTSSMLHVRHDSRGEHRSREEARQACRQTRASPQPSWRSRSFAAHPALMSKLKRSALLIAQL